MASNSPQGVAEGVAAIVAAAPRAAILVEGRSDQAAVRALAIRRGRNLDAEALCVVALGGVTNLVHYARALGPQGLGTRLAGLYDEPETEAVRRGLAASGIPADGGLAVHGFHACRSDLEDELIRALGTDVVMRILKQDGLVRPFRVFQRQPAQRGRPIEAQMHRFLGVRSGRKIRYGRLLVEALDLDRVPAPLDAVLTGM